MDGCGCPSTSKQGEADARTPVAMAGSVRSSRRGEGTHQCEIDDDTHPHRASQKSISLLYDDIGGASGGGGGAARRSLPRVLPPTFSSSTTPFPPWPLPVAPAEGATGLPARASPSSLLMMTGSPWSSARWPVDAAAATPHQEQMNLYRSPLLCLGVRRPDQSRSASTWPVSGWIKNQWEKISERLWTQWQFMLNGTNPN